MTDPVITAHLAGESVASIAQRLGLSINTVRGRVWRYKTYGTISRPRLVLTPALIEDAILKTGSVRKAARYLHVDIARLHKAGYPSPGRVKLANSAKTPEVRALFDRMAKHRLTGEAVAQRMGVSPGTLSAWRCGTRNPSPFLLQCFRDAMEPYK